MRMEQNTTITLLLLSIAGRALSSWTSMPSAWSKDVQHWFNEGRRKYAGLFKTSATSKEDDLPHTHTSLENERMLVQRENSHLRDWSLDEASCSPAMLTRPHTSSFAP